MPPRVTTALVLGALATAPAAVLGAVGDVTRQGLLPGGSQAGTAVEGSAFSPDGRYLLLASSSPLAGPDTGGVRQLFVRDLRTGGATLASAGVDGLPAGAAVDDDPLRPPYAASLDGHFVVFSSTATDLVRPDSNGSARDVFRKDTRTGRITIVSRDSGGAQPASGVIGDPSISADGMRVAFTSGAAPLVPSDANGQPDVYVADLRAGTLSLVSRTAAGAQSPGAVGRAAISADGRAVAFEGTAQASVLAPGDTDGQADVYVARIAPRAIGVASLPSGVGGLDDGPSDLPSISGDGSLVAFRSTAPLAGGSGDSGASPDAFVRDVAAESTRRVSPATVSGGPVISVSGARVAFAGAGDVLVRTLATNDLFRASRMPDGSPTPAPGTRAAISGSGTLAAFSHAAGVPPRADTWTTDLGEVADPAPVLSARATRDGRRATVAGTATAPAGVVSVMVGGRAARVADDGTYSVTWTAPVGAAQVGITARSGTGRSTEAGVQVTRDVTARGQAPAAPRPYGLRVRMAGRWARVSFGIPVRASWRVELRRRTPGPARAGAFRLLSGRSGPPRAGRVATLLRVPARTAPGRYQVRVLTSSTRGLGTAARTITVP